MPLSRWLCRRIGDLIAGKQAEVEAYSRWVVSREPNAQYTFTHPLHGFVAFMTDCKGLAFHASPSVGLDVLKLVIRSRELSEFGSR